MSTSEGAMTDLSSVNSAYLSTTVEEPELGSIDFRQSLRFFQEQLIINKGFSSPTNRLTNNEGAKFSINFTDDSRSEKHLYTTTKTGVFDEEHKSLSNCRISIPTVDTILESVRVLRAIQKSQEQRGSSWSLNVANPDTDTNLQYIHILTNSGNKDRNGSVSDDISEEDETIATFQNNETQNTEMDLQKEKCTVNGNPDTEQDSTIKPEPDETPSFWPRSSIRKDVISNSTPEKIKDFNATNLTNESSGNRDKTLQSSSSPNPVLDIESSDSRNIDFEFNKNSDELSNGIGEKEKLDKTKKPIILNGCDNSHSTEDDYSTTNQSQNGLDLPTNTISQDEVSNDNSKPDISLENSPPFQSTDSLLEDSSSEIPKLNQNFPDISRIYRISWDSIDSASATNSSLGEESSNKDSIPDSKCVDSTQMDKITCTEMLVEKEVHCTRESKTNLESLGTDNNVLEKSDALQKIPDPNCIFQNLSSPSLSPTHNENLRPGSVSDTCSSLYVSAECSPCPSFYEASDDNYAAYSNQHADNECKKETSYETWIAEPLEKQLNEPKTNECTSTSNSDGTSTSNSDGTPDNSLLIHKQEETTPLKSVTKTTENNEEIINIQLHSDKTINLSNPGINSTKNSQSTSEAVTEIRELLSTQLETPETFIEIKSNVYNSDSDNLNSPVLVTENFALNEPTETSNEDRDHETMMYSTETLKLTNGNSPVIQIQETGDYEKVSDLEKPLEFEETNEIHGVKKFTTSSWNLEAIMDSLYTLSDSSTSKAFKDETFQREVFIMSQGAFCNYPEGNYTVTLEQQTLQITQGSEANDLLTIPLTYGKVTFTDRKTLKLDNKLGRSLYFKFNTHEKLLELKEALHVHCEIQWELECIKLVHYPLKYHQNVLIVDLGSCSTRAGILMDEPTLPFIFFPSVCATDKVTGNHVYGKEALQAEVRQNSNLSFPVRPSIKIIKHSIDIDLVGGLFRKIFQDLRVDPTQYTIQVCLPRSLSISAQNALVKLLLEDFKVLSVSLTHQALLTLYAHNVSTGIVVDVGDRMDILPVVDGFIVENGVTRLPYGGQRLIHHMKHALAEKHISLSNDIDAFVVQYIAENLSYIAENYDDEIKIAAQYPDVVKKSIALQIFAKDNNCVEYASLDDARFKIPEGLFKPELWGLDNPGIHKLVQKAIQATSVDVRKKIAENIYVSGGVTLTPGFVERLIKEVAHLNKPRITPKVIASNYRYHCTYIGACKFAKMEVFPKVCVNLEDYSKNQLSSLKKFVLCF